MSKHEQTKRVRDKAEKINLDHVYLAGLFDGEGWFNLNRHNREDCKRPFSFQIYSGLVMRERYIIEWIQNLFGGSIYTIKPKSEKHSIAYRWTGVGETTLKLARTILPYLKAKKNQAKLAIEFQELKHIHKNKPVPDNTYKRYEEIFDELKLLNQKGCNK